MFDVKLSDEIWTKVLAALAGFEFMLEFAEGRDR